MGLYESNEKVDVDLELWPLIDNSTTIGNECTVRRIGRILLFANGDAQSVVTVVPRQT